MYEAGSLIRSLTGRPAARNYHAYVINEIGLGIVSGAHAVGSLLASDAAMMEQYGVSRTVLREAIRTLEAKGLVEARPKVGTRVTPKSRWNFLDPQVLAWHFHAPPDPQFYHSLFRVRGAFETPLAELAARHRTAEHVRLMKFWLHQMATSSDSVQQAGLGALEVHSIIAESAGDVLLRAVVGVTELTLALALTRESALPGAEYRRQSLELREQFVTHIEFGRADEAVRLIESCRQLDRAQVLGREAAVKPTGSVRQAERRP